MAEVKYKGRSLEEKKEQIEKLSASMEERIKSYFYSPENMKKYLDFMTKFHRYSVNNSILIQQQFMGANAVGSFNFWKDQGFSVTKGESGIQIFVPKTTTYFERGDKVVQLRQATSEERVKIEKKKIETMQRTFFDIGYVFDISQTNATLEDLPQLYPNRWLEGSVSNYSVVFQALEKVADKHDIKIITPHHELGAAKGASYPLSKEVALNPRNSELQNVKTLVHELTHAVLHTAKTHLNYTTQEKEFQVEMVAYTVSSYLGLDTSEYSLPYLHYWTEGKELKDQGKLLHEVRETAHNFISIMEAEIIKEREREGDIAQLPKKRKKTRQEIER